LRPTGEKDFLGEGQAHAVAKKKFAQIPGKIVYYADRAWQSVVSEMNQLIKKHLKNKPVTSKNLKEAGLISEGQSLPGRLIDANAIDQIQSMFAALGHSESIEKIFLRHLAMVTKKPEPSSLEEFFSPEYKAWADKYFSMVYGDDAEKFRRIENELNKHIKGIKFSKQFPRKIKARKYTGG